MTALLDSPGPAVAERQSSSPTLEVDGLGVSLNLGLRQVPIVTDVSFSVARGECVALVGESGCGKSITASAIMGLPPANTVITGAIRLNGRTISDLPRSERRKLCGRHIGFIFQEPMTALHPTLSIGAQMTDTLRHNLGLARHAAVDRAAELLDRVGIPRPRDILGGYVHELSGGMRQRVAIARAFALGAPIYLLDEPFGAVDAKNRIYLQDLLLRLWQEAGNKKTVFLVTHDIDEALYLADRIVVFTPSPGRIRQILPVPFQRPRRRSQLINNKEYLQLRSDILSLLQAELIEELDNLERGEGI